MDSRGGGQGDRRLWAALLLAASVWLYGVLLVLYPKAFRNRYASEMQRDFEDLAWEGLEEGGGRELARVWAATLSDLAVTALMERGTMLARNTYMPVAPRIATRLTWAIVLIAVIVAMAPLARTPQYEASVILLIGQEQDSQQLARRAQVKEIQDATATVAEATRSRPIAEDAIERLGLSTRPQDLLQRLDAEQVDETQFIQVSYTDSNPLRAQQVANTMGQVVSERVSEVGRGANYISATLWDRAALPEEPVSPNLLRNGLLTLVLGLMLCLGLAFAWPGVAASGSGQTARGMAREVARTANGSWKTSAISSAAEAAKEKELLEALWRHGELTVAGVARETSLTVKEADQMLSALAANGHLRVRARDGGLFYSFWRRDAPE
jgi:capsular polysaccharide biosynthesis protein